MSLKADFQKCFQEISDDREADLFVFNTDINITTSNNLIEQVNKLESRRKNFILFLTTPGGYIDPAISLQGFSRITIRNLLFSFLAGAKVREP
jgi:hypothetical protein